MSALLAQKRNKATSLGDSSDNPVMTLLQEAVDVHFAVIKVCILNNDHVFHIHSFVIVALQGQPFGIQYFKLLDPDLLIQITRIMLSYAPTEVWYCKITPAHTVLNSMVVP